MTAPVIGVLALQGDVREHVAALAGAGADARPVRRPAELDAVDGLVIPGGESTTISKLADIFEMREPIDKRIAGGMPVYGSCAGMIMLAGEVLDGRPDQRGFAGIDMTVRRNAFGRQVDSFEAPVEIAGVEGEPFHAIFIRAPWVERVGAGVEVLGRVTDDGSSSPRGVRRAELGSSLGPAAGRIVAVRQGHLVATSFHPELTGDLRLHRYFVDLVRAAA
ncbi:pyridoxal 5'-phosphate synthase glutaminase subunit PdxT [Micromonospora chersina]